MEKFNDYEAKKTQLLHREQPPSQEELDEVEEMVTSMEKKEAEKCRDVIAKLSEYLFYFMPHFYLMIRLEYAELQLDETVMFLSNYVNSWFT